MFHFDNSYLSLPSDFYSIVRPAVVESTPEWVLLNQPLWAELGVDGQKTDALLSVLSGRVIPANTTPFAQAYAGHQFGHFTILGDGRALVLGEHITPQNVRYDIQLKGSGQTPYSRRGDGKATLKAMLREYVMSEAMHALGIPTSRSGAVVQTNQTVYREIPQQGAILTRIMKSHLRVGTFEWARYAASPQHLKALLAYTQQRLYPHIQHNENPALDILTKVIHQHIALVVQWMRVGFIHGVMNTDNVALSGETFDYGPCAFMNVYNPFKVFSSIDVQGRYAFGKQPSIMQWNMLKFAETLLPLIDNNQNTAIDKVTPLVQQIQPLFTQQWYAMMLSKIGIYDPQENDTQYIDDLLSLMHKNHLDYTNTFLSLEDLLMQQVRFPLPECLQEWAQNWMRRLHQTAPDYRHPLALMRNYNPVFIPRSNFLEAALDAAENGNLNPFHKLLNVVQHPYQWQSDRAAFATAPHYEDDNTYRTFCGT